MILITGAAGFIGGNFVHHWFERSEEPVVVLDKLTYAGNPATIQSHLPALNAPPDEPRNKEDASRKFPWE